MIFCQVGCKYFHLLKTVFALACLSTVLDRLFATFDRSAVVVAYSRDIVACGRVAPSVYLDDGHLLRELLGWLVLGNFDWLLHRVLGAVAAYRVI